MERVLIVEDNVLIAMEYEDMVASFGYQVVGLASTHEHVGKLSKDVDIALVDLELADGMSGAKVGRSLARDQGISVIFITGTPADISGGITGTLGVVAKPASADLLQEALRYASAKRRGETPAAPTGMMVF